MLDVILIFNNSMGSTTLNIVIEVLIENYFE